MNNPPTKSQDPEPDFKAEIVQQLEPMLKPDKKSEGIQLVSAIIARSHSGPLPAPDDFEHYERVLSGSADRIMALTEREQGHRHRQEGRLVVFEYASRMTGQVGAMLALALMLATIVYCARIGESVPAAVLAAVGTIVIGFLKHTAARETKRSVEAKPNTPARRAKRK